MARIDQFFEEMMRQDGSDLHLQEGHPPRIRLNGRLKNLELPGLTQSTMESLLSEICGPDQWRNYQKTGDLDFAYEMGGKARFRANYFEVFRWVRSHFPNRALQDSDPGRSRRASCFQVIRQSAIRFGVGHGPHGKR